MSKSKNRRKAMSRVLPAVANNGRQSVLERARRATVALGVVIPGDEQPMQIIGSGVIVDPSGIIVTAKHVVDEAGAAALKLLETHPGAAPKIIVPRPARMVRGEDRVMQFELSFAFLDPEAIMAQPAGDIAVVRVPTPNGESLPFLPVDLEHDSREGDSVVACGFPYGEKFHERLTILSSFIYGSISAVVPHPDLPPRFRAHYLLQMPANPGNSGGAVFDPATGCVLGIVSRRYEPNQIPTGLTIATPIHAAEPLLEQLLPDAKNNKAIARPARSR